MKIETLKGPLAVVLTTLAILFAASTPALADAPPPLVLEGYDDPARPPLITSGSYEEIIALAPRLVSRGAGSTAVATNLCIAYIKTSRLDEARSACDSAVAAAGAAERAASLSWSYWAGKDTLGMARTYSNRAVLRWLSGDRGAARADLALAASYAPRAHFVMSNAAAFARRETTPAVLAEVT